MPKAPESVPKLRTQAAIAAVYAVDQSTVSAWMKNDTFPAKTGDGYDLAAVGAWIKASSDPEVVAERAKKLKVERERLELKLAIERNEMIPASHVEKQWSAGFAALRSEMQKTARTLSPQVSGKDAAECLKAIDARDRKVLNTISHVEAEL